MTNTVYEIEKQIEKLTVEEFNSLNQWISEFENNIWDKKILEQNNNSNLESLSNSALSDFENGNVKQIWYITQVNLFGKVTIICP